MTDTICDLKDCHWHDETSSDHCGKDDPTDVDRCENRKPFNVRDILKKYLQEGGYDGLFHDDGPVCSCELDDRLIDCGHVWPECKPGYKNPETWSTDND